MSWIQSVPIVMVFLASGMVYYFYDAWQDTKVEVAALQGQLAVASTSLALREKQIDLSQDATVRVMDQDAVRAAQVRAYEEQLRGLKKDNGDAGVQLDSRIPANYVNGLRSFRSSGNSTDDRSTGAAPTTR